MRHLREISRFIIGAMMVGVTGPAGAADSSAANYDEAVACSRQLGEHGDGAMAAAAHRRCIIAIATTYIDAEEGSLAPEKQLLADDVSRHSLGNPPNHVAGNAAKIKADRGSSVIAAIKNRKWSVDGNAAWIVYDGYLKSDPSKPLFYVAERLTIEKGLIREIFIGGVHKK